MATDVWEKAAGPHTWKASEIFLLVLIIAGLAFYSGYVFGHATHKTVVVHATTGTGYSSGYSSGYGSAGYGNP